MFGWLKSLYNGASGPLSAIEKWIMGSINAVYSYFDQKLNQLYVSLASFGNEISHLTNELVSGLADLAHLISWIINIGLPELSRWALDEVNKLLNALSVLRQYLLSSLGSLERLFMGELSKLEQWVIRNIWDPLYNDVSGAIHWIANEGALVYYLLTHPDKLAALLGKYLLASWVGLGRSYAKPFVRWLVHNMLGEASFVGGILEDILSSLF